MKKLIGPNLKLVVTKGPSSGQSSEFPPRTKVNVGRVVNGNKLTIKDAGISSKHLSLQFDSGSGHWTVTDLDSSNGTILNSKPIDPSTPYPISDGDLLKFGEETAIKIAIEETAIIDQENVAQGGRVTRQRVKLGVIKEDSELGLGFGLELGEKENTKHGVIPEENEKKVGRARVKKNQNIAGGEEGGNAKKMGIGRGKKNGNDEIGKEGEGSENLGENVVDGGKLGVIEELRDVGLGVEEELGKNEKKMGRGRVKKNENGEVGKEGEGLKSLGEYEVKDAGLRRVTRGSKRKGNDGAEYGEGIGDAGTGRVTRGGRITRSSRIQEMSEIRVYDANMDVVEKGRSKGNDGAENGGERVGDPGTGRVTRGGQITRSSRIQEMSEIRGYDDRGAANMDVVEKGRSKGNDGAENGERIGDAGTGRVTRGGRITRSSRIQEMSEIRGYDDRGAVNMDVVEKRRGEGPAKRSGTTSVENCGLRENVVEGGLVVNSEVVDERSKRNCTKVRKKLEVELKAPESLENGQIREEEMGVKSHLQEGDCGEGESNGDGDQVESMQENVCGDGSTNLKKTNLSVLGRLEKMTLGQWLDYIEEYLPKQIVAETEEMIMEMRRKAEKFHEFMLQQKEVKGVGDIK